MTVTSIVPVDKRKCKVFVDEGFAFVLYRGEISRLGLEEGGRPVRGSVPPDRDGDIEQEGQGAQRRSAEGLGQERGTNPQAPGGGRLSPGR